MIQENFTDDAEEASFPLNGMVAGFDENTSSAPSLWWSRTSATRNTPLNSFAMTWV